MSISGYNTPHLQEFSRTQLSLLAEVLPKGLTMRLHGGEESRTFQMSEKVADFLREIEADVITVWTPEQPRFGSITEWENELYYITPPTMLQFRDWIMFNFRKNIYYAERAKKDFYRFAEWFAGAPEGTKIIINLPLLVHQNMGYKAYAQEWLKWGAYADFEIDLHLYGGSPAQLRKNLEWYRNNTDKPIHFLEFNGLSNDRTLHIANKNSEYHRDNTEALLDVIDDVLGEQAGEILHFTLAANQNALNWQNSSYLHRYEVTNVVTDTLNNVFE